MFTMNFSPDFLPFAQASQPSFLYSFVPIILIFVIMYMLLIRPQQKKNKEHQEMIKRLKAGDKVITAGGIHGVLSKVDDRSLKIKVAENVELEFSRGSVASLQESDSQQAGGEQK